MYSTTTGGHQMPKKKRNHTANFKAEVALSALKAELTQAQITSKYNVHTTQIGKWKVAALEAIKDCFSKKHERNEVETDTLVSGLYEQIGRLQTELNWLKKSVELTIDEKRQLILPTNPDITLQRQCELLGLSRSSYYYQPAPLSREDERLMQLLDRHYTELPFEGKIKRSLWLSNQVGYTVGRKRVASLMEKMGIETLYPKSNTSAGNKEHMIYPYLLRDENITVPNQVWSADITYIPILGAPVYLIAIIDWYSRYVVEWALSISLEADFCVFALKQALSKSYCKIFNTDQGSQFTSEAWITVLKNAKISISMDGRGRYLDNIFVERLWRSVKQECVYLRDFSSVAEVKLALKEYFNYYNHQRLHQALKYKTPAEIYFCR